MAKEDQVPDNKLPADREAQLALVARALDSAKGGLLTPADLEKIAGQIGTQVQNVMAGTGSAEVVEEDSRLAHYKTDYAKWGADMKARVTWEEVQGRLLLNGGQKLKLAAALFEGGVMFGVDQQGKILFADGGVDVTDIKETTGKNYPDTRKAVMFRQDDKGKEVPTGYEMFPEDLIRNFETLIGHPFVATQDKQEYRAAWLESGENPDWARDAYFNPGYRVVYVDSVGPQYSDPGRGVRRLLRV